MPPIRNSCVARGTLTAGVATTIFTVPASTVLLLKDIRVWANTASAANIELYLADAALATVVNVASLNLTAQQFGSWSGWLAMNQTDVIRALSQTGNSTYWLSGALLPFVPGF